jgi:ADP-L-glycero-D-manno-heptose 6-epimerase
MIVLTGACGFIASHLLSFLNQKGKEEIVLVDKFDNEAKLKNLEGKKYSEKVDRERFFSWFLANADQVKFVIHLGARTDTTEKNWATLQELNLDFSQNVFQLCYQENIPLIYASSAATYGAGELGYSDGLNPENLRPLNLYGVSKNEMDIWAQARANEQETPPFWAGLKFFNVYGANEYHKQKMASVIYHAHNQIKTKGEMSLFRSHREGVKDGEQQRDFVYVKDVCEIIYFLMNKRPASGLYNVGSGKARTFLSLAEATFAAMGVEKKIEWMDTPEVIRDSYQYFTQADMSKLLAAGYKRELHSLEAGVEDYVKNYLQTNRYE